MQNKKAQRRVHLAIENDEVSSRLAHILLAGIGKSDENDETDEEEQEREEESDELEYIKPLSLAIRKEAQFGASSKPERRKRTESKSNKEPMLHASTRKWDTNAFEEGDVGAGVLESRAKMRDQPPGAMEETSLMLDDYDDEDYQHMSARRRVLEAREVCTAYHQAARAKEEQGWEDDEGDDDDAFRPSEPQSRTGKTNAEKRLENAGPGITFMLRWLLTPLLVLGGVLIVTSSASYYRYETAAQGDSKSKTMPSSLPASLSGRALLHRLHSYLERHHERLSRQSALEFMEKEKEQVPEFGPEAHKRHRVHAEQQNIMVSDSAYP